MRVKKNPDNIGYAVVGLGRGMSHVKCVANSKGAELLAVCDINEDKVNSVAAEYCADAYTDFKEMLKREDIDIVSICTPSGLHCSMAVEACMSGKNVLSEKPLDIDLSKIDRSVKIFEEKGLLLGCIFQNRFEPVNQKIKEAVDNGIIGKLILSNAYVKWYRTQEYYNSNGGWRGTWALDGGGSLMNQSVHTIDLMQWIMGPVKSVVGVTNVWSHDIETEDMGVALVKFKNGAFGTITGSTATYPGFGTSLEIHGVNGGMCMNNNRITSWKIKGDNMEANEEEVIAKYGPNVKNIYLGVSDPKAINDSTTLMQVQDMINAVKEKRQPLISGKEGRNAVEIILAIYESSKTGKEVFL